MKIEDLFSVRGKVALVTGGSRGLGEMMARAYVEKLKARNINASFLPLANETHNSAFRSPEVFNAVRGILQ